MSIKLFTKTLISTALVSTLAACGGGGDSASSTGTSTGTSPTLSLNLSNSSLTMDENTQENISANVSYTGSASLSYSYSVTTQGASGYSDISISDNKITVSANDVEQDVSYSVDVTLTDGTLSDTKTFQVSVKDLNESNALGLSVNPTSLIINEENTAQSVISVEYDGSEDIQYSFEYSNDVGITETVSGNVVTFSVPELSQSINVTATVTASAGDLTGSDEITLSLNDISGSSELAMAEIWASGTAFTMNEYDEIINVYTHAAYLSGGIKSSEKSDFVSNYQDLKASASSASDSMHVHDLSTAIDNYRDGTINSEELTEKTNAVKSLVNEHANLIVGIMNQLSSISSGGIPEIELNKFDYNEKYQVFSSLIGNESMGSFNGDTWEFSGSYEFMNTLVTVLGNATECEAQ